LQSFYDMGIGDGEYRISVETDGTNENEKVLGDGD
jgi:hypothetical protein